MDDGGRNGVEKRHGAVFIVAQAVSLRVIKSAGMPARLSRKRRYMDRAHAWFLFHALCQAGAESRWVSEDDGA